MSWASSWAFCCVVAAGPERYRNEHCVQAQSRTPTIATLYGARLRDIDIAEALADVCGVLRNACPIPEFREALRRLHPVAHENQDDQRGKRTTSA